MNTESQVLALSRGSMMARMRPHADARSETGSVKASRDVRPCLLGLNAHH